MKRLATADRFVWQGEHLPYFDHPYNNTRNNERAVEVPIASLFVGHVHFVEQLGPGLEVGNVLAHYGLPLQRRIVDLHELGDGVENVDVRNLTGSFPWIVSISTLEHVGEGTASADVGPLEALLHLRSLLQPGGSMLVTVPLGVNDVLDAALAAGQVGVNRQCTMVRSSPLPPSWTQAVAPVVRIGYDHEARSAAAVWIGEWSA